MAARSCVACRCLSLCSDLSNVVAGEVAFGGSSCSLYWLESMGVADGVVNHHGMACAASSCPSSSTSPCLWSDILA
ncbi:hypothetical protein Bca52824_046879 [Brassica carinata]|uniref:Uncharacterized protein n=1 Tax=Brassica carinata TaxID=52824 RepID=A0A8X7RI14_BRACI|nr:hypothetical protein Bca52824_046879 [Brassica carinata]